MKNYNIKPREKCQIRNSGAYTLVRGQTESLSRTAANVLGDTHSMPFILTLRCCFCCWSSIISIPPLTSVWIFESEIEERYHTYKPRQMFWTEPIWCKFSLHWCCSCCTLRLCQFRDDYKRKYDFKHLWIALVTVFTQNIGTITGSHVSGPFK